MRMWDVTRQRPAGRGRGGPVCFPAQRVPGEGPRCHRCFPAAPVVADFCCRLKTPTPRSCASVVLFCSGWGPPPPHTHSPGSVKGSVFFEDNKVEAAFGLERRDSSDWSPGRHRRARFREGEASAAGLARFSAPRALEVRGRRWSLCPARVFAWNVSLAAHSGLTFHQGGLRWP